MWVWNFAMKESDKNRHEETGSVSHAAESPQTITRLFPVRSLEQSLVYSLVLVLEQFECVSYMGNICKR